MIAYQTPLNLLNAVNHCTPRQGRNAVLIIQGAEGLFYQLHRLGRMSLADWDSLAYNCKFVCVLNPEELDHPKCLLSSGCSAGSNAIAIAMYALSACIAHNQLRYRGGHSFRNKHAVSGDRISCSILINQFRDSLRNGEATEPFLRYLSC